ncbi:MAG: outer membrane beta-barrel protein, partial [Phycisphaeraceae bacterium]
PWVTRAAVTALALTLGLAHAQPAHAFFDHFQASGFYVAGSGSYTIVHEFDMDDAPNLFGMPLSGRNKIFADDGAGFAVAFGYDADPFRIEGEYSRRSNDIDRIESDPTIPPVYSDAGGDITFSSFMANLYYDSQVYEGTDFYFGGGIGVSRVRADMHLTEETFFGPIDIEIDGREHVFAYQLMAGIAHSLTERLTVNAGYRFFSTESLDIDDARFQAPRVHILELGLRWDF